MAVFDVGELPDDPLAAATHFHAEVLPRIMAACDDDSRDGMTIAFAPADHTHRGWRLAAVRGLARARAPQRINALEADDERALAAAEAYLAAAPGVTGQLLPLDGVGAEPVLYG